MNVTTRFFLTLCACALLSVVGCGSDDTPFRVPTTDTGGADGGGDSTGSDDGGGSDDTGGADADTTPEDGAGDADTDTTATDTVSPDLPPPEFSTGFRLVQLSPDAPELDFYIDGEPIDLFDDMAFLDTRPSERDDDPYYRLETRTISVAFVPDGGTLDDAIYTADWPLAPNIEYTIWLHGLAADPLPEGAQPFNIGFTVDDTGELPDGGQRIRFFNALVGAPSLDFFISGTAAAEDIQFGFFLLDYLLIEVGNYTFAFAPTGTRDFLLETTIDFGQITANVFAVGNLLDGEVMLYGLRPTGEVTLVREEAPEFTQVRFVHGSLALDAASVDGLDVYRGSELLQEAMKFGDMATWHEIETGRHRFAAYAAGADPDADEPLAEVDARNYDADGSYTVALLDTGSTRIDQSSEETGIDSGARLFVHGATGLDAIAVSDLDGDILVDSIEPGGASDAIALEAGDYRFGVDDGSAAASFSTTLADEAATVLAVVNTAGEGEPVAATLLVVGDDGLVSTVAADAD